MATRLEAMVLDGHTVWFEVEDLPPPADKTRKTSADAGTAPLGGLTKTDLAGPLKTILASVHEGVKAVAPDEVTVELSFGLKGEIGLFVARSEGNAALKVTARWKLGSAADKTSG